MYWLLPGFFVVFGLPLTLFPRLSVELLSNDYDEIPEHAKQSRARSMRVVGFLFLLTAAVFAVLILTRVLR